MFGEEVWSSQQFLNLSNSTLIDILLKKVRHEKCDPLFWLDRPNLYNSILKEILLKKLWPFEFYWIHESNWIEFMNWCMEYFKLEMDRFFGSVDFTSTIFATSQMPDHYSHNILQGIKWKLSISSFYWYLIIWNCPSGLRAIASQSEAVFPKFQKCTYFTTSEVVIFGNFFSKCCHTKTNRAKDMKPTVNDHKFPKFL